MAKRSLEQTVQQRWEKKSEVGRVIKCKFQDESYLAVPVTGKTEVQTLVLNALKEFDVVVFSAPAGVGKSYLTMSEAADWLKKGV